MSLASNYTLLHNRIYRCFRNMSEFYRIPAHITSDESFEHLQQIENSLLYVLSKVPEYSKDMAQIELNRLQNPKLNVAVIATMSAGKSTLLNALIGKELLPSNVDATTAKIISIEDFDKMDSFEFTAMNDQGKIIDHGEVTQEHLRKMNTNKDVHIVSIRGDIDWVDNIPSGNLVLYDTPGPNVSVENDHKDRFQEFLFQHHSVTQPDLILYVMDATKLQVDDDAQLLHSLLESLTQLRLTVHQVFFVINKIDELDSERESVEDVVNRLKKYLLEHFDLQSPMVIPVCAMAAVLAQKKQQGIELSKKQSRVYQTMLYTYEPDVYPLHPMISLAKMYSTSGISQDFLNIQLFQRSGIPEIQYIIREYLEHRAKIIRLIQTSMWIWNNGLSMPVHTHTSVANLISKYL